VGAVVSIDSTLDYQPIRDLPLEGAWSVLLEPLELRVPALVFAQKERARFQINAKTPGRQVRNFRKKPGAAETRRSSGGTFFSSPEPLRLCASLLFSEVQIMASWCHGVSTI
jgi:hypothetical protein